MWVFLAYKSLEDYKHHKPFNVKVFDDYQKLKNYSAENSENNGYVAVYHKIT